MHNVYTSNTIWAAPTTGNEKSTSSINRIWLRCIVLRLHLSGSAAGPHVLEPRDQAKDPFAHSVCPKIMTQLQKSFHKQTITILHDTITPKVHIVVLDRLMSFKSENTPCSHACHWAQIRGPRDSRCSFGQAVAASATSNKRYSSTHFWQGCWKS